MDLIVAGAGPGAECLMTKQLESAVQDADVIITSVHFDGVFRGQLKLSVEETLQYVREHAKEDVNVLVMASGDTGFYSIAGTIARKVAEGIENVRIRFLCGISSMQYFAAATGMGYEDMKLLSLHGREGSIVPHVCYNAKVFALTGGDMKVADILRELWQHGFGELKVSVGERLSMPDERILEGTVEDLLNERFDPLSVITVKNPSARNPMKPLRDDEFVRGGAPMTKEAVRELAALELAVGSKETIYDIGAGTGAMTCTLALRAYETFVYAIEKEEDAFLIAQKNMNRLGIKNVKLVHGKAPGEAMDCFPPPDKVFIGGSSGNLKQIVEYVLKKNPKAEILMTAVTMETISSAMKLLKDAAMNVTVRLVSISDAKKLGGYHLMKAENPVYIIKGTPERVNEKK